MDVWPRRIWPFSVGGPGIRALLRWQPRLRDLVVSTVPEAKDLGEIVGDFMSKTSGSANRRIQPPAKSAFAAYGDRCLRAAADPDC